MKSKYIHIRMVVLYSDYNARIVFHIFQFFSLRLIPFIIYLLFN